MKDGSSLSRQAGEDATKIGEAAAKIRHKAECFDGLLDAAAWILGELPSNRDWLNPDCESALRAAVARAKGGPK